MDDQSTLPSSYRSFVAYGGYDEAYVRQPLRWIEEITVCLTIRMQLGASRAGCPSQNVVDAVLHRIQYIQVQGRRK